MTKFPFFPLFFCVGVIIQFPLSLGFSLSGLLKFRNSLSLSELEKFLSPSFVIFYYRAFHVEALLLPLPSPDFFSA